MHLEQWLHYRNGCSTATAEPGNTTDQREKLARATTFAPWGAQGDRDAFTRRPIGPVVPRLPHMPHKLALPTDRPYPPIADYRGARVAFNWPVELQVTPFTATGPPLTISLPRVGHSFVQELGQTDDIWE